MTYKKWQDIYKKYIDEKYFYILDNLDLSEKLNLYNISENIVFEKIEIPLPIIITVSELLLEIEELSEKYDLTNFVLGYSGNWLWSWKVLESNKEKILDIWQDFYDNLTHSKLSNFRNLAGELEQLGYYVQDIL